MDLGITTQTASISNLRAGDHPPVQIDVTIAAGEGALAAGTVLGRITASGEYGAYDNGASDGTQTAIAILSTAVDATSTAQKATAFVHGEFNAAALTGLDAAGRIDLQSVGIYVKTVAS